jgi:hypothetical protein
MIKLYRYVTLSLALCLAACSDSTGPKTPSFVGVYGLATINNGGLPATIFQNSAGRIVISSAIMTLRQDNSYLETRNYATTLTTGGTTTSSISENGSYTVVGSQITFTIPPEGTTPGLSYTGAVSGRNLTYTFEGISYGYVKNP